MLKNTFLLAFFAIIFTANAHAQTVNGISIDKIETEYVQIIGRKKNLSSDMKIIIDFGKDYVDPKSKTAQIKDESGEIINFTSMIDALNFMSKNGYEYLDAHTFIVADAIPVFYYMLKKKKA